MANPFDKNNLCKYCTPDESGALIDYLTEILKINESINLTSIRDFDEAMLLHLEDSLTAKGEIDEAIEGPYLDMGCGGGFPGVPLGVVTRRKTTLIDSRAKKIRAVEDAISKSGVDKFAKFDACAGRIEEFSLKHRGEFSVVTARALSSLTSIMELASPLLKIGGSLVCLKAKIEDDEIVAAREISDILGYTDIKTREFFLSDTSTFRTLITLKKVNKTRLKLPRRTGLAQKSPLRPDK